MSDAGGARSVTVVVVVSVFVSVVVTVMTLTLGVIVTVSWTVVGVAVTVTLIVTVFPPRWWKGGKMDDSAVYEVRVESAIVSVEVRMEVEKEVLIDVAVHEDIVVVEGTGKE